MAKFLLNNYGRSVKGKEPNTITYSLQHIKYGPNEIFQMRYNLLESDRHSIQSLIYIYGNYMIRLHKNLVNFISIWHNLLLTFRYFKHNSLVSWEVASCVKRSE